MAHVITKKVRLDDDYARRLARLAKGRGRTESEILREGIDLVEQLEKRQEALDGLIEMAKIRGPPKELYRFK